MGFELNVKLVEYLLRFPINPETGNEDIDGFGVQFNYL